MENNKSITCTEEEMLELAKTLTQKQIAEKFGVTQSAISYYFKTHGLKFPRKPRKLQYVNDHYFDEIDTEEKAYLLGFFVADGCVKVIQNKTKVSYRMSFDNTIKDEEAILLLHERICPDSALNLKHIDGKTPQYTLQWNSDHMGLTLINKYHICPRKTHDANFKIPEGTIPDNLWRHFIRGFMDGDGHIDNHTLYFVFTSLPFCQQVMNTFNNFDYKIYEIKGKNMNYWRGTMYLTPEKKGAIKHFLYDNATVYLKRKLDSLNTEITYALRNKVVSIVEHRVE